MNWGNFSLLRSLSAELASLGEKIERLYYVHPEESLSNMRKFAEGVLVFYFERNGKCVGKYNTLGELIAQLPLNKRRNAQVYPDFKCLLFYGNKAAHFQRDEIKFKQEDIDKCLRSCYEISKWLCLTFNKDKTYPEFSVPTQIDVVERESLEDGWYPYYFRRKLRVARENLVKNKWMDTLYASVGFDSEIKNDLGKFKFGDREIVLMPVALALVSLMLHCACCDSCQAVRRIKHVILRSLNNEYVKYSERESTNNGASHLFASLKKQMASSCTFEKPEDSFCESLFWPDDLIDLDRDFKEKFVDLIVEYPDPIVLRIFLLYLSTLVYMLDNGFVDDLCESHVLNLDKFDDVDRNSLLMADELAKKIFDEYHNLRLCYKFI